MPSQKKRRDICRSCSYSLSHCHIKYEEKLTVVSAEEKNEAYSLSRNTEEKYNEKENGRLGQAGTMKDLVADGWRTMKTGESWEEEVAKKKISKMINMKLCGTK
jgi:hypothetical protein